MKPLQCLPKQLLKSPTGARLVLYNDDTGYPDRADPSAPARGRWLDNIAVTERAFLRTAQDYTHTLNSITWKWPAAVLTPEEYSMRVGGMSVAELRRQLEEFWGPGGVPGPDSSGYFQGIWVPARGPYANDSLKGHFRRFTPRNHFDHLNCSHWANKECTKWLSYFIAKNHTLGVVHAWFAAFLGVIKDSLFGVVNFSIKDVSHLKFRMSFDMCMEGHDEAVDGLPSLSHRVATTTINGVQVIRDKISLMYPRRIWDICANTVIPAAWICGPDFLPISTVGVRPVSHAWVADGDLTFIMTEANQQLWPIPLPKGTQLEDVRQEMIRLGVRYAWLDVLCLRQQALAKNFAIPVGRGLIERREKRRLEEWKIDVPTIGAIYSNPDNLSIYGDGPTVIFMNGLGRPFQDEGWASERHWLRRAWTLQESQPLKRCLIAGLPEGADYKWNDWNNRRSGSLWPWNCKVCI